MWTGVIIRRNWNSAVSGGKIMGRRKETVAMCKTGRNQTCWLLDLGHLTSRTGGKNNILLLNHPPHAQSGGQFWQTDTSGNRNMESAGVCQTGELKGLQRKRKNGYSLTFLKKILSWCGFPGGAEWQRICLPMQEMQVQSLGGEDWGRYPGEGNGNPLQCSCLGNPMDRAACIHVLDRHSP